MSYIVASAAPLCNQVTHLTHVTIIAAIAALLVAGCDQGTKPGPADKSPSPAPKTITTPTGLAMALIPAGEFIMGDNNGDADEKPAHKVQVSSFYMDTHEVTQKAYETFTQQNPSKSKAPDLPVEQVDWYHAILYCNLRSLKEGLSQKAPNPWGLCDMHGNVAEWCHDIYSENYYQQNESKDPRGPSAGDKRVLRGGSWRASEDGCRSSARNSETPRFADACFGSDAYGFRCVRGAK